MGSLRRRRNDDPIDRLRHVRPDEMRQEELNQLLHELQVHQEELSAQNSQLIETQRALEESRDRYVDLYDFAPIGYMTISPSGIIREINLTGAALLRKERGKIIGLPFNAFLTSTDKPRFSEHLRQCRRVDHASTTVELSLNTTHPPPHVQLVTRGTEEESAARGFLTAIIDITERKRLEKERRDAEEAKEKLSHDREIARARVDAKDHFLATLSHELRTPLTPIVATMSNDRLISLAPEPLHGALQIVRRNLDLEVRLIDDLLDVTRISRDRLVLTRERVNVHVILHDVLEMLDHEIRQRGIQTRASFNAPNPWVIGDATRLRQVFWNLVGNAIKFTNVGGQVAVTSSAGQAGFVHVNVNDTGSGMDAALIDTINENAQDARSTPIQSTTGLGLGLAICRGVISAHGGTLRALSPGTGRGSTFVVEIPFATHLEQWDQPPRAAEQPSGQSSRPQRILLVEDHQDSADMLSQLLMLHDFDVCVARTVEEAVSLADQEFDLLISDVRLPDGSGLDLIRRLQSHRPIRGIAISGFGTEQDQHRSREAGYDLHLTKPVDFNRLLDAIERVGSRSA
jgi:PAS domain S-box-containing protein